MVHDSISICTLSVPTVEPGLDLTDARLVIQAIRGPDAGKVFTFEEMPVRIGRSSANDVKLADNLVSSRHLEIVVDGDRFRLRDLGSTNGTFVDGVRVTDAVLCGRTTLRVGRSVLAVSVEGAAAGPAPSCPKLIGISDVMLALKHAIVRIAASDATVLIGGETGTGKEVIAESIHHASPRRAGPFVVVDCGAIPAGVFEAELFGHERGAFTGAINSAAGLFERADGGTLFLDEIGELPPALQPKLLRAVQTKMIRRVGGSRVIPCDVRVVAATNRDLRAEVAKGTFRADLYYRLAVACLAAPPLRDRPGDVPLIAAHFARELVGHEAPLLVDSLFAAFKDYPWPGNVRELRNVVERALCDPGEAGPVLDGDDRRNHRAFTFEISTDVPFKDAKQLAIDEFDRRFITALLDEHGWNIAEAARSTGLDRVSIYKIMNRLGIARPGDVG